MTYRVPDAAAVDGDELVYGLDFDPQATVAPPDVSVTLHLPRGYGVGSLPLGWSITGGRTLTFTGGALDESREYAIAISKL